MPKLKFGVRLNIQGEMGAGSAGFAYALEMARIAEDLGFDSIWIPDHVENAHLDRAKPILEHWTTLTAIGAMTKRLRLGGHSLNNLFRHPGLFAKMVATLDEITQGRVIVAPGSAWFEAEARSYGFDWDDPAGRVARLDEALAVMRALWTQPVTTHQGRYFTFRDAYCNPKPVQQPHPPIWIAGDSTRTQGLVRRHADCWFMYSKAPASVADLVGPMRASLARPLQVAVSAVLLAGKDATDTRRWAEIYAAERQHRFPVPPTVDDVLGANLLGEAGAIAERIEAWAAAGVGYVVIQPMPPVPGMRFFGERLLPRYAGGR
ncbi:MAG: LLM class flavin-dependent oxidoreductase [Alphaproteobacteria bacterium]|nr:LLM class flavin-dependent oxidoreductase [Alphaproteobacteria bacterium]